jgi:asparaginyl-tRNA synthetase
MSKESIATNVTTIDDLGSHVDKEVQIQGWLYNRRSKGKIHFLILRDGSGLCQAVAFKGDLEEALFEQIGRVSQESSVKVTGKVRQDDRAPGGYELGITAFELVAPAEEYPIAKQAHGTDFLLSHRHLWLRSRLPFATLRVRHTVVKAIRDYFDQRKFTLVDAPIFTPAACEGTTTLFELDYFSDDKAYLTQSGQLYMEAAAMAFGRVYCFGPAFRAERSKTRRHLTEFWMVEPEMAYAELDDVISLGEGLLETIVHRVLETNREELKILERDVTVLEKIRTPFPRVHYDDAVDALKKGGIDFEWGGDFGAPDEDYLSRLQDQPTIVHRFPADIKAFYMKQDPEDERLSLSVDFLAPEGYGEIIGGGQRADDLNYLLEKIQEYDLPKEAFEWYLDLRRYGTVPHGGFGLGVERTVGWLCGNKHIRECIPFPRMLYRIYP